MASVAGRPGCLDPGTGPSGSRPGPPEADESARRSVMGPAFTITHALAQSPHQSSGSRPMTFPSSSSSVTITSPFPLTSRARPVVPPHPPTPLPPFPSSLCSILSAAQPSLRNRVICASPPSDRGWIRADEYPRRTEPGRAPQCRFHPYRRTLLSGPPHPRARTTAPSQRHPRRRDSHSSTPEAHPPNSRSRSTLSANLLKRARITRICCTRETASQQERGEEEAS